MGLLKGFGVTLLGEDGKIFCFFTKLFNINPFFVVTVTFYYVGVFNKAVDIMYQKHYQPTV